MKRILAILLALLIVLSLTACGSKSETASNTPGEGSSPSGTLPTKAPAQEATPAPTPAPTPVPTPEPTPAPPEMVSITVPSGYVDSEMTEEELQAEAAGEGMEAVLNEDGSVTYTMTKEQHEQIMADMTESFDEMLRELTEGEEAVESFREVKHNESYSDFDILVNPELYSEWDAFIALSLVMYAGAYRIYSGDGEPEVEVRMVDAETGEVYDTVTYQDFMDFAQSMSELDFGDDWDLTGTPSYSFPIPELAEQTLLDAEGVTVTATGLSDEGFWGPVLNYHVKNDTDKEIMVVSKGFAVNDFYDIGSMYCTVPAGEEADDFIYLPASNMEVAGMEYLGKLEVQVAVIDPETYDTLAEGELVELRTSDYDEAWQVDPEGTVIYEGSGITIKYLGAIDNQEWENYSMNFCLENTGDCPVYVSCDEMKLNGVSVEPWFYAEMLPGKKTIAGVGFSTSEFAELGIGTPETVEMTFTATDTETDDEVFTGELVTFPAGEG